MKTNRKISNHVHSSLKMQAALEGVSMYQIIDRAIALYKDNYPDVSKDPAPTQNPLVYPTMDKAIALSSEVCEYLNTLPKSLNKGGLKSVLDRIVIHYQNNAEKKVPEYMTVRWLDIENTKWSDQIPEG